MRYNFFPLRRYLLLCALTLLLAACGGGGGGGSAAVDNAGGVQPTPTPVPVAAPAGDAIASVPDSALVTPGNNSAEVNCPDASAFSLSAPPAPANGKIKGRISFERVPFFATPGQGLNYANPQVLPARGIVVEALTPTDGACSGPALATTLTDGDGWYELAVAAATPVCIRARAQLYRAADDNGSSWNFAVADNTADNRLYALIESGAASPAVRARRDLHAASGWSSGDYRAPRVAAPFAALDTLCKTLDAVLAAKAPAQFGQLTVFWSDRNGDDKNLTLAQGNIGGTHFDPKTMAIYLRGDADVNADEFDEVVIAHEFGHFATQRFSRSDTIGGRHY
ncbi:MAG TPA: hypothetical protein VLC91_01640, partial [Spongiibacteraceae bacterium]|nr:hypothetical protein [Spongiibacteraceae bacterium]